jgi:flagellar basal body rod protein FlgF
MTEKHLLSEDLKLCVQEVLGLAQRTVDLQYDDETQDELQEILLVVSEAFDIVSSEVHVEVSEDGTITAKILNEEPTQTLPDTRAGIKLVSDNGDKVVEFKRKDTLPPGFELTPDNPQSGSTEKNDDDVT